MKYWTFLLILALALGITGLSAPLLSESPPEKNIMLTSKEPALPFPSFDRTLQIPVLKDGQVVTMSMEAYLIGVLGAEMPSDFPPEALKAQAVAARTFALHQAASGKHPEGAVCTDPRCCQGWSSSRSEAAVSAVKATDGLVLTYGGSLIDATFFSCSGGRTESAQAVWGGDVPYLQAVDSPGEESAPGDTEIIELAPEYFAEVLSQAFPDIHLEGSPETWLGKITCTPGGGIDTAEIGGVPVSGCALRRIFSLRSTSMEFQMENDAVRITTHGYGHRVGMSQYGARAMAEDGRDFTEILCHYYQGIKILRLRWPEMKKASSPKGRGRSAMIMQRCKQEKQSESEGQKQQQTTW